MRSQHLQSRRGRRALGGLLAAVGLALAAAPGGALAQTAGAQTQVDEASVTARPYDPLEKANRGVYGFSMGLDHAVVGPIAHGYMAVAPKPVRNRVSAFIYNLGEPGTVINDGLQGHPRRAGRAAGRFLLNSTVGVLGLFDVASRAGIAAHDADFGQTLGRYGFEPGPYLYIPIIGPLDLRDGVGRVVDIVTDPVSLFTGGITTPFGATRTSLSAVDTRVQTDGAFRALEDATDPYATARSAYTQHRVFVVHQATGEVSDLPDFDAPPPSPAEPSHP
ncbi:MAG TPA: VacJ family lipoprotein [Phenylobacterium sp.]|nr:VacJ family lipoprotein [Phenylobacterium sp.]